MSTALKNSSAQTVLTWLSASDALPDSADAVIGFGHFDRRIPVLCGALVAESRVRHLIFTGGIGAGTGTIGRPEADFFHAELRREFPTISDESVFIENRSTNTAENIRFTTQTLEGDPRKLTFHQAIKSVVLVAHPLRLRRVRQTWRKLQPDIIFSAIAPPTTLATELEFYARESLSLETQLVGEIDRLLAYPNHGWIEPISIPDAVLAASHELR